MDTIILFNNNVPVTDVKMMCQIFKGNLKECSTMAEPAEKLRTKTSFKDNILTTNRNAEHVG